MHKMVQETITMQQQTLVLAREKEVNLEEFI